MGEAEGVGTIVSVRQCGRKDHAVEHATGTGRILHAQRSLLSPNRGSPAPVAMNTLNRRLLCLALASPAIIGAARRANAQPAATTLKIGHEWPADHPAHVRLSEAAANIARRSDKRVVVEVFPNSQLGGASDMLSQVRSGALELLLLSASNISSLIPLTAITSLGYVFSDYDQVWKALDGELGEYVKSTIKKANLYPMGRIWDIGYRHVTTTTKRIEAPTDLSGLKVRVQVSPQSVALFRSLGASPVAMSFNEVYTSLQTRVLDGAEFPLQSILSFRLNEVLGYTAMTAQQWDGMWLLANNRIWSKLAQDARTLIEEEFNAAAVKERQDIVALENQARNALVAKGMKFNEVDKAPFRSRLIQGGYYREWKAKFDPAVWTHLENVVGPIG